MQQLNGTSDTKTTTQVLADAALAFLTPRVDQVATPSLFFNSTHGLIEADPTGETAHISVSPRRNDSPVTPPTDGARLTSKTAAASSTLPSLLQYVDHILMKDTSRHNNPPHAGQTCVICNIQWDKASTPSTFLPLFPCSDWVHYRCLIWLAIRDGPHREKCYACNKQLFEWDGISALTLATRTSLSMGNSQMTVLRHGSRPSVTSDKEAYEQDCQSIVDTINRRFFEQLAKPSGFADKSPCLVECFNSVLDNFKLMGRPQSKWLKWSTDTGSLLFGMLVAIKMKRYLMEGHNWILQTEAWIAWEDGCRGLQRQILEEIHKD